ncbi:innate immunity activator protein-like isoform X2 [Pteropus vampyrus]|uniref:Innate immunity activator protein-like isoform X2 n=1 Tax=Pteropus vampyrus TaxID=132908 RepID=A0A6P6C6Z6_PTEVA|nr:innate immunity activator protein-like isoform X2 [Pteropus vampyrus]
MGGRELHGRAPQPLPSGLSTPAEAAPVPEAPPESPPLPPQNLEGLQPAGPEMADLDQAPIQNSPWRETSLDHPYEKPRKPSEPSSEASPATTPQDRPGAPGPWLPEPAPRRAVPIRSVPGQWQGRTSAPPTPEVQGRRGQSLR